MAARLTPGQYFGEIALLRGTERTATVRAALDTGVEVITLDRSIFNTLMAQSEPTRESVDATADRRYAETEALLKKK